jgi:hypothetical protein
MLQFGQHTAFARKAPLSRMPHERRVQQLYGHLAFESPVTAMSQPDCAHPTVADRPIECV